VATKNNTELTAEIKRLNEYIDLLGRRVADLETATGTVHSFFALNCAKPKLIKRVEVLENEKAQKESVDKIGDRLIQFMQILGYYTIHNKECEKIYEYYRPWWKRICRR